MKKRRKTKIEIPLSVARAKHIAARLPRELGFVNRAALLESYTRRELIVIGKRGFCHFHLRRDHQATIYELGVAKEWQGQGIGTKLVRRVSERARKAGKTILLLRCPVDLAANDFYRRLGFRKARVERGRIRKINVWVMRL